MNRSDQGGRGSWCCFLVGSLKEDQAVDEVKASSSLTGLCSPVTPEGALQTKLNLNFNQRI